MSHYAVLSINYCSKIIRSQKHCSHMKKTLSPDIIKWKKVVSNATVKTFNMSVCEIIETKVMSRSRCKISKLANGPLPPPPPSLSLYVFVSLSISLSPPFFLASYLSLPLYLSLSLSPLSLSLSASLSLPPPLSLSLFTSDRGGSSRHCR